MTDFHPDELLLSDLHAAAKLCRDNGGRDPASRDSLSTTFRDILSKCDPRNGEDHRRIKDFFAGLGLGHEKLTVVENMKRYSGNPSLPEIITGISRQFVDVLEKMGITERAAPSASPKELNAAVPTDWAEEIAARVANGSPYKSGPDRSGFGRRSPRSGGWTRPFLHTKEF